jgi:hypothetical protein
VQQLQAFRPYLRVQGGHTRYIAAWPVQSRNQSCSDRVGSYREDDGDRCGRRFRASAAAVLPGVAITALSDKPNRLLILAIDRCGHPPSDT